MQERKRSNPKQKKVRSQYSYEFDFLENTKTEAGTESSWINYGRWNFLVSEFESVKCRRAFAIYYFWKHILFEAFLFWLHDYPVFQVLSLLVIELAYTLAYVIVRAGKTKVIILKELYRLVPMTVTYFFTFFNLHRELKFLRWGNTFRYYLVGLTISICLFIAWTRVLAGVFYYFFTGLWEWGNKITEKCRGAEEAVIVIFCVFSNRFKIFEEKKPEIVEPQKI